ncbi:acyl-CoA thioesterase [Ponticaulis profundi]|uniref:Acyl-CoA thioesterase n=1 Tax=Ponticaulis profundi TaxID=2665222 RepID=A0ABW1S528_9PROT
MTDLPEGVGAVDFETAFMRPITPEPEDFDVLGHVNNSVYVRWVEYISVAHWDVVAPDQLHNKYVFVMLRHEIDYRDAVWPGETVEARTWLGRARGPRFERFVDIRKPGAKKFSSFSRIDWCQVDAETKKPVRVGPDVLETFKVPG